MKKIISLAILLGTPTAYSADQLNLPQVEVKASRETKLIDPAKLLNNADAAYLLADEPGLNFYQSGGVSSLPTLRGMNDDRIRIVVDGAEITSACGNHMNSPLSYIAPSLVHDASVMAGITPVSMGGDSIAGTITLNSKPPRFSENQNWIYGGSFSSFYRSNNNGLSTTVNAFTANDNLSIGLTGTIDRANSYKDGNGDKVRSTQFDRRTQTLTVGAKGEDQLLTLRYTHQDIPYQGYVNQFMDMVGNQSDAINLSLNKQFKWGDLDTRLYWQDINHQMGFFSSEKLGMMPMNTKAKDLGYSIKATIPLKETQLLRVGNEFHRNNLTDVWPPVAGSMMMGPLTYININDGRRERLGTFAELESRWDESWSTLLGVRHDFVRTDAGEVQPYSMMGMMSAADIAAARVFNAADRSKTNHHFDLTALAKFKPDLGHSFEFGYARKTRSPTLYERYSWGRGDMAMSMIGWFGDGNGYVGDPDLKPETAHTLSASAAFHNATQQRYVKFTPYFTYVADYIGATRFGVMPMTGNARLQFENHDARFYGMDVNMKHDLWDNSQFGRAAMTAVLGVTRGERVNSDEDLYQIMPVNLRMTLEQKVSAWTNALEMQMVGRKTRVDQQRNEPETSAYTLLNLRTSYAWQKARLDFSVTNLLDKFYYLPLGGVNVSEWRADGMMTQLGPVAGMGRSLNVGLTVDF